MEQIVLENIKKEYGEQDNISVVLDIERFALKQGSMTAITGPSGSGKTSLLNILGMLDNRYSGKYYLNDRDVSTVGDDDAAKMRSEKIGFVFQEFNLIKEMTAKENVMLALDFSNIHRKRGERYGKKKIAQMAENALDSVGLSNHINKRPGQLSGGQKQRVAIARAIVNEPDIILADEPTGALDTAMSEEIIGCLKELNKNGKTIIIVTHDMKVAARCDSRIELTDGRIKLCEAQTAE